MPNPLDTLTPAELRTELGAAVLELDRKQAEIERLRDGINDVLAWYESDKPNMRPLLIQGINKLRKAKEQK